jgi:hypothetical protein
MFESKKFEMMDLIDHFVSTSSLPLGPFTHSLVVSDTNALSLLARVTMRLSMRDAEPYLGSLAYHR